MNEQRLEQPDHNRQKKLAVINDFCGFGRCSIAVSLPIISAMGLQCCPMPTAVFSNHTGFPSFYSEDFTPGMGRYMDEWEKLGLRFHGIATGYLGSAAQIETVKEFLQRFKTEETKVLIDPVMGDYGRRYPSYTEELANRMHELVPYADLLTPNLTEACILTGIPYTDTPSDGLLFDLCVQLSQQGPECVVISGIERENRLGNYVYLRGCAPVTVWTDKVGLSRSGTGDVFSAILAADLVRGVPLVKSVTRAADYIGRTIRRAEELGIPATDGICIEETLGELIPSGTEERRTNP